MTFQKRVPLFTTLAVMGLFLAGCQTPRVVPRGENGVTLSTRNNCYSLLHQLLEQQKDVSMLRFIKREHPDVKNLIKRIAAASGAGAKLLEKFAADDPSINLADFRLPPGENATRDAIAATKQKELLGQHGDEFELSLLLTQTEALSYAWHLAQVTSANEYQPDRARALTGISKDMQGLYHEVFFMILAKTKPGNN